MVREPYRRLQTASEVFTSRGLPSQSQSWTLLHPFETSIGLRRGTGLSPQPVPLLSARLDAIERLPLVNPRHDSLGPLDTRFDQLVGARAAFRRAEQIVRSLHMEAGQNRCHDTDNALAAFVPRVIVQVRRLFAIEFCPEFSGIPKRMSLPAIKPMVLTRFSEPFSDPDWLFEVKHDGFRALAYVVDRDCRLVSRRNHVYKSFATLCQSIVVDL